MGGAGMERLHRLLGFPPQLAPSGSGSDQTAPGQRESSVPNQVPDWKELLSAMELATLDEREHSAWPIWYWRDVPLALEYSWLALSTWRAYMDDAFPNTEECGDRKQVRVGRHESLPAADDGRWRTPGPVRAKWMRQLARPAVIDRHEIELNFVLFCGFLRRLWSIEPAGMARVQVSTRYLDLVLHNLVWAEIRFPAQLQSWGQSCVELILRTYVTEYRAFRIDLMVSRLEPSQLFPALLVLLRRLPQYAPRLGHCLSWVLVKRRGLASLLDCIMQARSGGEDADPVAIDGIVSLITRLPQCVSADDYHHTILEQLRELQQQEQSAGFSRLCIDLLMDKLGDVDTCQDSVTQ